MWKKAALAITSLRRAPDNVEALRKPVGELRSIFGEYFRLGFSDGFYRPRQFSRATIEMQSTGRKDENIQMISPSNDKRGN